MWFTFLWSKWARSCFGRCTGSMHHARENLAWMGEFEVNCMIHLKVGKMLSNWKLRVLGSWQGYLWSFWWVCICWGGTWSESHDSIQDVANWHAIQFLGSPRFLSCENVLLLKTLIFDPSCIECQSRRLWENFWHLNGQMTCKSCIL